MTHESPIVGGDLTAADLLATPDAGPAAIRGGVLRVAGYVTGALLSVVSAALLFRHLGVVDTGLYVTALSLVAIIDGLSDLGLTAIGVRELSVLEGDARSALARNLLGLRIVLTIVGVLAIIAFTVLAGYRMALVEGVALAGVGLLLQSSQASLAISLMSRLKLGWVTVMDLSRQAISVTLIITLVALGAGLVPFLGIAIPAAGAVLVATALLVRGDIPLIPAFERVEWRPLVRLVLPYSAAVAAAALYFRVAIVLVSLMAGSRQLGYFSASFRVVEVIVVVPGLILGAAFPIFARAARDDRERLAYAVQRVFQVTLMVGVGVALSLAIGSHLVIEIVGGSRFKPAAEILAIQSVAVGATFTGALWGNVLLSLGRLRTILLFNLAALGAGIVAVAALVSVDGARGAAIATAGIEVIAAVAGGVVAARVDRRLAPAWNILPRLALAGSLAALTELLPVPDVVRLLIAIVVYAGGLVALRLVPDELWQELRRLRGQALGPGGSVA